VLWDLSNNPSPETHTSQVLLGSLTLLRWSLLTSGEEGWMVSCFPLYQLLDTTLCTVSVMVQDITEKKH